MKRFGSSSNDVRRRMAPTRVIRSSPASTASPAPIALRPVDHGAQLVELERLAVAAHPPLTVERVPVRLQAHQQGRRGQHRRRGHEPHGGHDHVEGPLAAIAHRGRGGIGRTAGTAADGDTARNTGPMPPIDPPTLRDGEVTLRPLGDGDVAAMVRACRDPDIPRWTRVPEPYTPEDARRFLAIAAAEAAIRRGRRARHRRRREDRLVGTLGLMEVDRASASGGDRVLARPRGARRRRRDPRRPPGARLGDARAGAAPARDPRPSGQRALHAGRRAGGLRADRRGPQRGAHAARARATATPSSSGRRPGTGGRSREPAAARGGRSCRAVALLVLLLPGALEGLPDREPLEALLRAPGAVAVEPARVSYGALAACPPASARSVARRQARRMRLPGIPRRGGRAASAAGAARARADRAAAAPPSSGTAPRQAPPSAARARARRRGPRARRRRR